MNISYRPDTLSELNTNAPDVYEKIQFLLDNPYLFNKVYEEVSSSVAYELEKPLEFQPGKEPTPKRRFKRQTYPCNCNGGYSSSTYSSGYSSGYPTSQTVSYNSYQPVPQTVVVNNTPRRQPLKAAVLVGGAAFTGSFVGSRLGGRRRVLG